MNKNKVTHCICFDRKIDSIIIESKKKNLKTIDDIKEETGCGTACGMCIPYIERELRKK
jgi:NAD(P)H-nitrite reductase large subunit